MRQNYSISRKNNHFRKLIVCQNAAAFGCHRNQRPRAALSGRITLLELSVITSFPKLFGIPDRRRADENSSCAAQFAM
jgi:hypothetical protein